MSAAFFAKSGIEPDTPEFETLRQHFAKILQICIFSHMVLKSIRKTGAFCVSEGGTIMYTILESSMTRYSAGVQMSRVTILVDDAADVPEPHDTWDSGSICMIAEDHSYKILNNAREWV